MTGTINEEFFDALVRHQVGLMRLAPGMANRVDAILKKSEKDIARQIKRRLGPVNNLDSPVAVMRMNRLLKQIKLTRIKSWKDVNNLWVRELRELAASEAVFVDAALKTVVPVILNTAIPEPSVLAGIVKSKPFHGKVLREWSTNVRQADLNRIEAQIKIGMIQGESNRAISQRIVGTVLRRGTDGVLEITRRQSRAITRTLTNGVANSVRTEYFKLNDDLFTKERYTATLDSRTSRICSSLDGEVFPISEGPQPPIHINCRSLRVAVVSEHAIGERPARAFTERGLLNEFTEKNSLRRVGSRAALPRGNKGKFDDFARIRKRELTGRVQSKISYQEWLKRQSVSFQEQTMGKTKARLFREGKMPLDRFVNRRGDEFTLRDLARSDAGAFEAAGLNPRDFL